MGQNPHLLRLISRSIIWKSTPGTYSIGFGLFVGCAVASLAGQIFWEYVTTDRGIFVPYGLNAAIVILGLGMVLGAMFAPGGRVPFVVAQLALSLPFYLVHAAFEFGLRSLAGGAAGTPATLWPWQTAFYALTLAWWVGATAAIFRSVMPAGRRPVMRAIGLYVATLALVYALPYEPVFRGRDFDIRSANLWEYIPTLMSSGKDAKASDAPSIKRDEVELAQPRLLDAQAAALTEQVKGKADIFALGIAGWGGQRVFIKELTGGLESLSRLLPLEGHVLRLVNNAETVKSEPIASRQNFAAAVRTIAQKMDRDEDVLLLFITSHGGPRGVALELDGAVYSTLTPQNVADVLDGEGIKNRIIIVSACFAGTFIKPLATDNTIILTAADETHTSFGCSDDREWTYFGDALFNQSLRSASNLEQAFTEAKATIAAWEARDGIDPSNPQAHFGKALMERLAPVYAQQAHKPMRAAARE